MMFELESYLNKLLGLSPLICNLVYVRDFLLNQAISNKTVRERTEITPSLNESYVFPDMNNMRDRADSFSLAFDQMLGGEEPGFRMSSSKKDFFM